MTTQWISQFALWLADLYFVSALLLAFVILSCTCLSQPARRMSVARAAALGLVMLAILTAVPGWPRLSWLTSWMQEEEAVVSPLLRFSTPIAGGGAGVPDRQQSISTPAVVPTASPVRAVSLPQNSDSGRGGAERVAVAMPIVASSAAVKPTWTRAIIGAFVIASLVSLAWLLVGALAGSDPVPQE